jgi:hypothetical protein
MQRLRHCLYPKLILETGTHTDPEVVFIQSPEICAGPDDDTMRKNESSEIMAVPVAISSYQQAIGRARKDSKPN